MNKLQYNHHRSRSGTGMVLAVVGLALVSIMTAVFVGKIAANNRSIRRHQMYTQAVWFAEAAIGRAERKLESDSEYRGESWSVEVGTGPTTMVAQLRVSSPPGGGSPRSIQVDVTSGRGELLLQRERTLPAGELGESK